MPDEPAHAIWRGSDARGRAAGRRRRVDLPSQVGVTTPALRKRLIELQAQGLPLEREEDPPDVWWSMAPHWFPGAVVFSGDEIGELPPSARSPG
jgi:hypothetical protein